MITLVSAMYTSLKEICVTMHTKPVLTGKSNDYRDTIGTRTCSTEMSNKQFIISVSVQIYQSLTTGAENTTKVV